MQTDQSAACIRIYLYIEGRGGKQTSLHAALMQNRLVADTLGICVITRSARVCVSASTYTHSTSLPAQRL